MTRNSSRWTSGHGKPLGRPISWIFVTTVVIVFTTGGIALIADSWPLFWTCAGLLVAALPVARAIRITDDTVTSKEPLLPGEDPASRPEDPASRPSDNGGAGRESPR